MIDEILPNKIISIVGSGGKTTFMYALAEKLSLLEKKVVVTTSTKIFVPEKYPIVFIPPNDLGDIEKTAIFSELNLQLKKNNICVFGNLHTNNLNPEEYKLSSFLDSGITASELISLTIADYILIEADGSKHMPLKFPNNNEPVITDDTEMVIAVVGIWCIGSPISLVCHRFELACEFLSSQYGYTVLPNHIVTMKDIDLIVNNPLGYHKNVGNRSFKLISYSDKSQYANFKI